jgi:hypothetical protein
MRRFFTRLLPLLLLLPLLIFPQNKRPATRTRQGRGGAPKEEVVPPVIMRGTLRSLNKKEIVIDAGDDRIVTFRRLKKTKFLKGTKEIPEIEMLAGAAIVVEASRERDGEFDAVNVFLGEPPASLH